MRRLPRLVVTAAPAALLTSLVLAGSASADFPAPEVAFQIKTTLKNGDTLCLSSDWVSVGSENRRSLPYRECNATDVTQKWHRPVVTPEGYGLVRSQDGGCLSGRLIITNKMNCAALEKIGSGVKQHDDGSVSGGALGYFWSHWWNGKFHEFSAVSPNPSKHREPDKTITFEPLP